MPPVNQPPAPRAADENPLERELFDLLTLMPDSQTQKIIDYILLLRQIRAEYQARRATSEPTA